ncbi:hypothetical protein [Poriferisphaera sp. WC338]|uniref:hypothetical protein n=1 Tax=Poriferisphaera sp. WC338 TaxID=3425129 RepID=UPI003D8137E1
MYDSIDSKTDTQTAHLMSQLPGIHRWDKHPLPRRYKQMIAEMDEQTVLSLIHYAIKHNLEQGTATPPRFDWD